MEVNFHQTSGPVPCIRLLMQANEGAVAKEGKASEATCISYCCSIMTTTSTLL